MNDEHSAQLTDNAWRIPEYLQPKLLLVNEYDTLQPEGETGLFELTIPAKELMLYAGSADEDGVPLRRFRWQPDALNWAGQMGVGGTVEALTIAELYGVPLTIITMLGSPLKTDVKPYVVKLGEDPTVFEDGLLDVPNTFYTWLAPEDSPLVAMAENALINHINVWFMGRIAAQHENWHKEFSLPLILESGTMFAAV